VQFIPWRVKNFLSEHFPLAYHLVVNLGTKGNDQAYWDKRLEETWGERDWPTKSALIAALIGRGEKVLDIGCGTGSILRYLKERGYGDLHGLEISRYAVHRLRAEGITMHHGALPRLPLADNEFDVIIASQVLRPGGQALIFVPNDCLGPIDESEHVVKYNRKSFTADLTKHFEIVSIEVMRDAKYPMSLLFGHVRRENFSAPSHAPPPARADLQRRAV
jgi:SAM-dependent methyltransferase